MQVIIGSDPIAVREGLAILLACSEMSSLGEGARGKAEVVLAEVLNNIVEHAYADKAGDICVDLRRQAEGVFVVVSDEGRPFPNEELPEGTLPQIEGMDDLPEGGFGWFLIRTLVRELTYRRNEAGNFVSFLLPA
jgi:serine/threonine-protein kinase RsbW